MTQFADRFSLLDNTSVMELSKAVAGTALLIIILLALGHASALTNSQETPQAEESQSGAHSGAQGAEAPGHG